MVRNLLAGQRSKGRIAVIEHDQEISYRDLIHKASVLKSLLPSYRVGAAALFLPDSADYVAAFWGIISAGRPVLPINAAMTGHEIGPLLKAAAVNLVVTSKQFYRTFTELGCDETMPLSIIYMEELTDQICQNDPASIEVSADETMVLMNTSGTTGKYKIVELSERNIDAAVEGYLEKAALDENEIKDNKVILAAPFSSVYGLMILTACLKHAFPIVIMDHNFTLNALYRTIAGHQVTHYEGSGSVITMMEQMAGRPVPYDISSLRYMGFGGSKVSGKSIGRVMKAYPQIEFSEGYGMTEAAPLIAKRPRGMAGREESAGTAIAGLLIVIETESGRTDSPGIIGEIIVKGPNVMRGYYNDEEETARVFKNGYLYTGDIGYLDRDGFLYICGRKKNLIIVRGFNVYPEEVEACIQNSMLVKDCFVYGQTDCDGNESVCADVIPLHSQVHAAAIKQYCSTRLAEYKLPQKINLCETIAKNMTGKTERSKGVSSWS